MTSDGESLCDCDWPMAHLRRLGSSRLPVEEGLEQIPHDRTVRNDNFWHSERVGTPDGEPHSTDYNRDL